MNLEQCCIDTYTEEAAAISSLPVSLKLAKGQFIFSTSVACYPYIDRRIYSCAAVTLTTSTSRVSYMWTFRIYTAEKLWFRLKNYLRSIREGVGDI